MIVLRTFLALAFSVVVGVGTARWAVEAAFEQGAINNGPWSTNEFIGSTQAGPYLRAGIAIGGLLALNRSETVYYHAARDSDGEALVSSCRYRIVGRDPATRWWSITAYGSDHYLIPNPAKRYSVDRSRVVRGEDGRFEIQAGGEAGTPNWIPLAPAVARAPFSLTLRLYQPEEEVTENLGTAELPRIERGDCL